MNKNQKLLLGAAVVGVAGYLYWKNKQATATTATTAKFTGVANVAGKPMPSVNKIPKIAGPSVGLGKPGTFKQSKANFAVKNTMPQMDSSWVKAEGVVEKPTVDTVPVKKNSGFFAQKQANSWIRPATA